MGYEMIEENTKTELDLKKREKLIDELLVFMKNEIEQQGATIKNFTFNFMFFCSKEDCDDLPDKQILEGEHLTKYKMVSHVNNKEFDIIFKCCITHEYIDRMFRGREYSEIRLTNKGMARANSVEKSTIYESKQDNSNSYTFTGPINAENIQIGNNNTQNIEKIINNLKKEVEKIDATDEEKNQAKDIINKFFSNPIVSAVISGATGAGIRILTGGM